MKRIAFMFTLTFVVGMMVGLLGKQVLSAQQAPPTTVKGQTAKTDRFARTRPTDPRTPRPLPPRAGGHVRTRWSWPAAQSYGSARELYILQGTLSDCTPDGKCVDLHEGHVKAEGKNVVHWPENKGTRPLIFLAVDISKEP